MDRVDVVATVLLLAAVPLAARRFFGPAYPSRLARILRAGGYVAILALMPAKAVVEQFAYTVPHGGVQLRLYRNVPGLGLPGTVWVAGLRPPGSTWLCESLFLFITAGYVAAIFWLTSRRSLVAPATLAIGLGTGLVLGAVMYAVAPLGLSKSATNPWLPGSDIDPLVWLAWIVLLCGPVAAGVLAGRHYRAPHGSVPAASTSFRQGVAAGLLANLVGALFVTVLGTGTIALTLKSAWLRQWLYHGQHLAGTVSYSHELTASSDAATYLLICLAFPVIGLALGVFGGMEESGTGQSGPPPGGGGGAPGPCPEPPPPGGRRLPGAGAEEALLLLDRLDLDGEEAQADLVGAAGVHAGPS